MPGDYLPDDLKTLWEELSTHTLQLSPEQLRGEAQKLRTGVRRRSLLGAGACLIVAVAWTIFFFVFPNWWQRVGSIFTVIGSMYMLVQLRMGRAAMATDFGQTRSILFYRAELERQKNFHRGKCFWSRLFIFVPGLPFWFAGFAQAHPELKIYLWCEFGLTVILLLLAIPLNLRLARRYQRRIDAVNASLREVHPGKTKDERGAL